MGEKKIDIEKAMKQAKASLAMEGIKTTIVHDELVRSILTKEITEEEFEKRVMEIINQEKER
ncbi:MAG TPA: hypothetical protein VEY51_11845 [Chondromyces sp.]|nr:hypothetical protein [Chondromyces sp.]